MPRWHNGQDRFAWTIGRGGRRGLCRWRGYDKGDQRRQQYQGTNYRENDKTPTLHFFKGIAFMNERQT